MLRIGAVSYLNTKPLIYTLRDQLGGWGQLSLDLPSQLAEDLSHGRLDIALIPSVEYFRGEGYEVVSDALLSLMVLLAFFHPTITLSHNISNPEARPCPCSTN